MPIEPNEPQTRPGRALNPGALVAIAMALALGCSSPVDWSDRPLVSQDGVVDNVKFRWTVPEGMKKDEAGAGFALRGADPKQPSPRLQVLLEPVIPASVPGAVKAARLAAGKVIREEEIPGGYVVSGHTEDRAQILVNVWRQHEGGALHCQAAYALDKAIPSFDKMRAMLEAVCLSMGASE